MMPLLAQVRFQESPISVVVLAAAVVAAAALYWPARVSARVPSAVVFDPWSGGLDGRKWAGRVAGVAVLLLAVVTGRLGEPSELRNLAAPLLVGLAWPALLFVGAAAGPVWRSLDPWDGLVRALALGDRGGAPQDDVRWALAPAVAWAGYLSIYRTPLAPRSVGLVLAGYTIVMVAGALAVGRLRWLPRVELFGLMFSWLARLPRGALESWAPPRGAEVVLGALAGGLLFGLVRQSELWGALNVVPGATVWATLGFGGSCAAVAGLAWWAARWAIREGVAGSVTAALVPAVGAVALAVAMARSRLFTSLQLLPQLLGDPFGFGWDPFGIPGRPIEAPLGPTRLAAVQVATLVAGHVAGAIVLGRRAPANRGPGTASLVTLVIVGTLAILLAPGA
ncbi:MAG: hypothetical protein ACRDKA_15650 [Actinomycetota bacterium]